MSNNKHISMSEFCTAIKEKEVLVVDVFSDGVSVGLYACFEAIGIKYKVVVDDHRVVYEGPYDYEAVAAYNRELGRVHNDQ